MTVCAIGPVARRCTKQEVRPVTGLREVLFPKRGLSATELLLAINLTVAIALFLAWGRDYPANP